MLSSNEIKVFSALTRNGERPALREIADDLGISHEWVRNCLIRLEHKGYVRRMPATPRRVRAVKVMRWPNELRDAALASFCVPGMKKPGF
jgi:sugar-specific transcriptional regulator TrmB